MKIFFDHFFFCVVQVLISVYDPFESDYQKVSQAAPKKMAEKKLAELRLLLRTNKSKNVLFLRNLLSKENDSVVSSNQNEVLKKIPPSLAAFLIETADAHQSEYVSASNKRREYISGFTGSSGTGK